MEYLRVGHDGDVGVEVRLDGPVLCDGTAGAGKSGLLRAVVAELVASHAPDEVTVALAGAKDPTFADMNAPHDAPHVAALVGPDDLGRFTQALDDELWRRRTRPITGPEPALLVVIDDADHFGADPVRRDVLRRLARFGRPLGIHLVVTAQSIDMPIGDLVRCRVELTAGIAVVSADGQARYVTPDSPGSLAPKPGTPARNLLHGPAALDYPRLLVRDTGGDTGTRHVPLGLRPAQPSEHAVLALDPMLRPHLWIEGDRERGKTAALRTLLRGVMDTYTKDEAVVVLADLRRTLAGFVDTDRLIGYAVSPTQLTSMIGDVVASMRKRLSSKDDWTGPRLFLVVDDYDLLLAGGDPLAPLTEFLRYGTGIGLHTVVAGAPGIGTEGVVAAMAEHGCWGIALGGKPGAGRLVGDGVDREPVRLAWVPATA
jgi:DNA translocase FtsK/SpoIIIE-like protein